MTVSVEYLWEKKISEEDGSVVCTSAEQDSGQGSSRGSASFLQSGHHSLKVRELETRLPVTSQL